MISKNHQFPDPVDGPTKTYLNVRSSREYAEWVAALARTTRRSRQELVESQLSGYKSNRFNWLGNDGSGSCDFDSLNA
jgi:hypothetical protein